MAQYKCDFVSDMFGGNQLFILFEFEDAGCDLESFKVRLVQTQDFMVSSQFVMH